jgi:hypothetical protein
MIDIEVLSSGSRGGLQKGCWMHGPPEEVGTALEIACRSVQSARPKEGVAVIIRRAP